MLPEWNKRKKRLLFLSCLSIIPLYVMTTFPTGIFIGQFLYITSILGMFLFLIEGFELVFVTIHAVEMDANIYNVIQHLHNMEEED